MSMNASGCAAGMVAIEPEFGAITSYRIGEVQRASVGEPIVKVEVGRRTPTFIVREEFQPPRVSRTQFSSSAPLRPGMVFRAVSRTRDGTLVLRNPEYATAILASDDGTAHGFADQRTGGRLGPEWTAGQILELVDGLSADPNAFRGEIIYSGLDGNTVRAVYREFAGDFIRPAFAQDLQYNLEESREIAYRSLRIHVIRATNSLIEYRVEEDGGLPWLPRR